MAATRAEKQRTLRKTKRKKVQQQQQQQERDSAGTVLQSRSQHPTQSLRRPQLQQQHREGRKRQRNSTPAETGNSISSSCCPPSSSSSGSLRPSSSLTSSASAYSSVGRDSGSSFAASSSRTSRRCEARSQSCSSSSSSSSSNSSTTGSSSSGGRGGSHETAVGGNSKKRGRICDSQGTDGDDTKAQKKKKKRSLLNSNFIIQDIRNKQRRQRLAMRLREEKKKARAEKKKDVRKRERRGEVVEKKAPRTIESMRRFDPTVVDTLDEEIAGEEEVDEFSPYFKGLVTPKLMITTSRRISRAMYDFLKEVLYIFPNSFYYKRGPYHLKNICKFAAKAEFTDLLVIQERKKRPYGLYIVHLPEGPTSYFRLTSVKLAQEMKGAAALTTHRPELLLNNFSTRLGCRIGRQLAALFPLTPDFVGRRVVTFHNQRDFIFFRHHRYIFEDGKRTRLQEIGPRMTLKLLWLHAGLFNTREGMYEFVWRPDLKVDRKNMLL